MSLLNSIAIGCSLAATSLPVWAATSRSNPATPANGDTVVLLHGMGRTPKSMAWLGRQLERGGFRVVNLGYPSTRQPIERLATHVRSQVERDNGYGTGRVHFVTHSLGGIVLRAYLKESRPTNLGRVVMLGPPNQGSELVDRLRRNVLLRRLLAPAGLQLGTGNDSIPNRLGAVDFELGVIAGSRSINPFFSRCLPGPHDGKVSVQRTRVEGMKESLIVPHSHTFLMWRRSVATQVIHFLQQGRFHSGET